MSTKVSLFLNITVKEGVDPETVAESVFRYLASDPDDLFPNIETVDHFDYQIGDH